MSDVHDFKDYKAAKIIYPHIDTILKVLNLTERSLNVFSAYIPVYRILLTIRREKVILEEYKSIYKSVIANKGRKNES